MFIVVRFRSLERLVGDPHFATVDDLRYTFNGIGEFRFIRLDLPEMDLFAEAQVRTVRLDETTATVTTVMAAGSGSLSTGGSGSGSGSGSLLTRGKDRAA